MLAGRYCRLDVVPSRPSSCCRLQADDEALCDVAGKGGKNRSRAKSDRDGKRELNFKNEDEGQEYAQVCLSLWVPVVVAGNTRVLLGF